MTIRELANLANVSPAAVSIVLNGKKGVSEETRKRVQAVIDEYHYIPTVRNRNTSRTILCIKYTRTGMYVEENQGFVAAIQNSMSEYCRKEMYSLLQIQVWDNGMNTFKEIDYSSLCGAVIIATELPEELYPVLRDIPVPFVVVDNMMPGTNYSCVGIDNFENIYTMLRFCKAMGYRTIGCLTSSFNVQNLQSREEAFMKYTNLLGLSPDKNWILSLPPETISVVKALAHILKNKKDCKLPQCFLAVNDMIALGAIRALEECGYRVPEDIGVMGFDDILYASLSAPPLTTIHVQREAIGRQAIRQLLHLIKDPASTAAKTAYVGELVVRNSMMDLTEKK